MTQTQRLKTIDIPEIPISDLLSATAARSPGAISVIDRGCALTYEELNARVEELAQAMRPLVAGSRRKRIGLTWTPTLDGVITYYSVLRSGAVMVGLMPPKPSAELTRAVEETQPDFLILDEATREKISDLALRFTTFNLATLSQELSGRSNQSLPSIWIPPISDDPAVLAFTSGTTGPSKCVRLTHKSIVANAVMVASGHRMESQSVVFVNMPIMNPLHMNAAVSVGASFVIDPAYESGAIAERLERYKVTHFYGIPALFGQLGNDPSLVAERLETVKYFSCGSKALAPQLSTALEQRFGVKVFQGYGQTETAYHSHVDDPDNPVHGSVGLSLPNTDTRVVDVATRESLPIGSIGEVEIRGPQLMDCYMNRPDLEPFAKGEWFMTGDIGYLSADGHLFVIDRLVDIGYRNGIVISPSELERQLEAHPGVKEAGVVLEAADVSTPLSVIAFVVPNEAQGLAAKPALSSADLQYVDACDEIYLIDRIPRLPINGKVDRKTLLTHLPAVRSENFNQTDIISIANLYRK